MAEHLFDDFFSEETPVRHDVKFVEKLKESAHSVVFKVEVRGRLCVMKVYRDRGPCEFASPDREVDLFTKESTAYQRLKEKGLCQRGVIPDFYGTITKIQPKLWPTLDKFHEDELPPNAVLIEYIPNMQQMDLTTFSTERLVKLREILDEFHQARVLHGDPKPRNMMVCSDPERVLWIDFDAAQTFPEGPLSAKREKWVKEEVEMMEYFMTALAEDYKEGKINRTCSYYYEWFV
ncbi:hypothetical protein ASPZODRAFT_58423 [Penicilliopsis zonata CBS 506.65]|uniref:Protein kinase domain-containing protein n=1 Tax=Penicilliopsis zonata CBS 506.65 TaxID=1073090 RepID=A0A1L9ST97_9EURO|nr:hypothetical protein ASPZODRAFT_58423 [Penicilliopsis zonata CBS 506.65]OJJ50297.1 hypothetical protein ASPZODRAFT_58423 [Penicilliopsis zonata CBS 506.65]